MLQKKIIMKNYTLYIVICFFIYSYNGFSQNFFYIGDNKYEASEAITFSLNSYGIAESLDIFFVKTGEHGGYLGLNCKRCGFFKRLISGDLTLLLSDGSKLKINPNGLLTDIVDDNSISLYRLNNTQISILKEHSIETIRFQLYVSFSFNNTKNLQFDSNKTASNREIDTSIIVQELFE